MTYEQRARLYAKRVHDAVLDDLLKLEDETGPLDDDLRQLIFLKKTLERLADEAGVRINVGCQIHELTRARRQ